MPKGVVEPRRLSRARLPPPSALTHTNSVSSNSSTRERNTRSAAKPSSPQKSSTPQSLTSEEVSETRGTTSEPPQLRRSKRQLDNDDDETTKLEDAGEDEIIEDEETTRCVCGQSDYPGPPNDLSRSTKGSQPPNPEEPSEERGGLFIQCDDCQVWQHGGCVSIMEDPAVPDNYYCEQCKPDLHELFKTSTGQNFSHYLPVWEQTHPRVIRKTSVAKDESPKLAVNTKEKEKERLSRGLPDAFGKRRSTMNSRSAYDEDEVLRKVLEESKAEGSKSAENASRKGKRFRDESEDTRADIKRQRTTSSVISSQSGEEMETAEGSELEKGMKKPPRGAAARSQREKESRDRDKDRADAANKRKERLGRRRVDESELPEESSTKTSSIAKASPTAVEIPETPEPIPQTTSKRGGKRVGAGRGRVNQAPTPSERDEKGSPKDVNDASGSGENNAVPAVTVNGAKRRGKRGQHNHQESGDSEKDHTNGHGNGVNGSDPDAVEISTTTGVKKKEPSMAELKRRAAAMLEWVERAKDDLVKSNRSLGGSPAAGSPAAVPPVAVKTEMGSVAEMIHGKLLGWQVEYATS